MRKQIRGLDRASDNCQDGVSLCQVADGALAETHEMLHRMTELSVQAANGTLSSSDRTAIQKEVNQIKDEINRISENTKFNEVYPLKGTHNNGSTYTSKIRFDRYIGIDGREKETIYIKADEYNSNNVNDPYRIRTDENGKKWIIPNKINEYELNVTFYGSSGGIVDGVSRNPGDTFEMTFCGYPTSDPYGNGGISLFARGEIDLWYPNHTIYISGSSYSSESSSLRLSDLNIDSEGDVYFIYDSIKFYPFEGRDVVSGEYDSFGYSRKELDLGEMTNLYRDINVSIHAGADCDMTNKIGINTVDASAKALGINELDMLTEEGATNAINEVCKAIQVVSAYRSYFGAVQNRIEHTIANLDNVVENTQAAESRIRDTDMAKEVVNNTKLNILEQAATSMMSQANQSTQGVLSLLQ